MRHTIRVHNELRQVIDRSPDDRLRNTVGMGLGEPERRSTSIWPVIVVLVLLAAYATPDFIAWARGDAPVVAGRMK